MSRPQISIKTTLTNPGIIDRLEQDILDYLAPFGFRLDRADVERATLTTPRCSASSVAAGDAVASAVASSSGGRTVTDNGDGQITTATSGPVGTLCLHVHREALLSTVGPLLRTFLRLSPAAVHPLRLRSVVFCHFTLDASHKWDQMNATQRRDRLRSQEDLSARRMAHHVHVLVRNSMGAALCMGVAVVLPLYRRRTLARGESAADESRVASEVPLPSDSLRLAMKRNPDACYPSVQLLEQRQDDAEEAEGVHNNSSSAAEIHLDVRTRMCTVRHQPLLFRWVSSFRHPMDNGGRGIARCGIAQSELQRQLQLMTAEQPFGEVFKAAPLIVACIEKMGNLHRILMLCHDYDKMYCTMSNQNDNRRDGHSPEPETSLLSNMIVVLPNSDENVKNNWNNCENALDHFHRGVGKTGTNRRYRPTFIQEEHAAEKVSSMIKRRQSFSTRPRALPGPSIVGLDLHPHALTLHGNYALTDHTVGKPTVVPSALQRMRDADALVFGYESTGIPESIVGELNGWVQIPSRSSINVVAALSIALDALLGAGRGVDIELINKY